MYHACFRNRSVTAARKHTQTHTHIQTYRHTDIHIYTHMQVSTHKQTNLTYMYMNFPGFVSVFPRFRRHASALQAKASRASLRIRIRIFSASRGLLGFRV